MLLTDHQFDRTRRLALTLAGIELAGRHRELLERRSRRLGVRDTADMATLLDATEAGEPAATQRLLGLLTTKFTGFFRHPRHFDAAATHARRVAGERGTARLWSAAAATGEEAWSLALAVLEAFHPHDPPVSIFATDVDAEALAKAQRGEYAEMTLQSLSARRRERFFSRNQADGFWSVAPSIRRLVQFHPLNLTSVVWSVEGPFDVVFCRNVLMYLEAGHRYAVLERMASLLASDGLLLLDPAEHLGNAAHWFAPVADGMHVRRRGLPGSRHAACGRQPVH